MNDAQKEAAGAVLQTQCLQEIETELMARHILDQALFHAICRDTPDFKCSGDSEADKARLRDFAKELVTRYEVAYYQKPPR